MQLKYKYFAGGRWNPYAKEEKETYKKITEERRIADPMNEMPIDKVFPTLDSWAEYVIATSLSTFWKLEKEIGTCDEGKEEEIESIWKAALTNRQVPQWLLEVSGEEIEKAMCFYIMHLYKAFNPTDISVEFKLYFSEGHTAKHLDNGKQITYEVYEY